jgi:hypothetical protein
VVLGGGNEELGWVGAVVGVVVVVVEVVVGAIDVVVEVGPRGCSAFLVVEAQPAANNASARTNMTGRLANVRRTLALRKRSCKASHFRWARAKQVRDVHGDRTTTAMVVTGGRCEQSQTSSSSNGSAETPPPPPGSRKPEPPREKRGERGRDGKGALRNG